MALPKQTTTESSQETLKKLEQSCETLRLNFCEDTPVAKLIFKLTPTQIIAIQRISYSLGGTDLSANGYISLVVSKVENPDVWSVSQNNSQIILDKMTGANSFINDEIYFFNELVIQQNEPLYVYLFSNMPAGVKAIGKLVFYFNVLHL